MKRGRIALVAVGVLALSGGTVAMQLARPETDPRGKASGNQTDAGTRLVARLKSTRGGETITLAPGDYGVVKFPARTFQPAIRIVADKARFTGLVLRGVTGVTISGGTVNGPGGRSYGITIGDTRDLTLENMTITGAHRGIVLGQSDRVTIVNNRLTGLISDGIDIARASNITVRGNSCSNFSPTPTTFDAAGKRLTVGDHPDCIQAWSRPISAPTSDIVVENNRIEGAMQGVFFGNHVRKGVDDGGFDRVVIRNNRIRIDHPNGIVLMNGRNSVVTGNEVSTLPGSINSRRPDRPVRAMIRVKEGAGNRVCGNRIADFPRDLAARRCS